jgi:Protein of unknown function (DUF2917)
MNTALTTPAFWAGRLLAAVRHRAAVEPAPVSTPWRLAAESTVWIARPLGRTVRCEAGTLWLTFDGEPQDLVLSPGQSLRCTRSSKLGIHALSAARFTVD